MYHDSTLFTEYWTRARTRTMRVLDQLSDADLEWSYAPGRFTFGDLYRHLGGMERYMFAENVLGRPSSYPGHAASLASGVDAVRAYVARCHAESLAIFSALSRADLESRCSTPAGGSMAVWKWLRSMVEHEAHHRGQLYLMASMRDIRVEPLYGLTEEQVEERSRPGNDVR